MTDRASRVLVPAALCLVLHGCAAALVPVAVGGLAARRHLKAQSSPKPPQVAADRPRPRAVTAHAAPSRATTTPAAALPEPPTAPADPAAMIPETIYRGDLPRPGAAASTAASSSPATRVPADQPAGRESAPPGPDASSRSDWNDLTRHVAIRFGQPYAASVLLARGSTLATPQWVPCSTKPVAVLADLDAVVPASGPVPERTATALGAIETMQATIVYTSRRTGAALAHALAALPRAGLHPPASDRTLFPITSGQEAAARAMIGGRYCVVAIAGDRPDDFPNQAQPGPAGQWHEGWFLVPTP